MSKKITLSRSKNLLKVVPPKKSFWLCINQDLRSLNSLADALDEVNDDVFRYHVNKYKNDFSTWVRDFIGDNDFAREISRIKTKDTLVRKIREKVNESREVVAKYKAMIEKRKKTIKKKKPKRKPKKKVKKRKIKKKRLITKLKARKRPKKRIKKRIIKRKKRKTKKRKKR